MLSIPNKFMRLKKVLPELGKFSKEELELVGRSYDIIGDVAIIEIPKELKNKEIKKRKNNRRSNNKNSHPRKNCLQERERA